MATDRATPAAADRPGVAILPPVLYALGLALGFLLQWVAPRFIADSWYLRASAGAVLLVGGFALVGWARGAMERAGTNVDPRLPATALVTAPPFHRSRNPLYVALNLIYVGVALLANSLWLLLLLLPLLLVMHFAVIHREERYLEAKFGDAYRNYRSRVRRYF